MKKLFLAALLLPGFMRAETGRQAWLRYAALERGQAAQYDSLPAVVVALGGSPVVGSARDELIRGVRGMLGRTLRREESLPGEGAIVLGNLASLRSAAPDLGLPAIAGDGFWLAFRRIRQTPCLIIAAAEDRGVLYGAFELLSRMARLESLVSPDEVRQPRAAVRWVDQWDNLDGTIERGYGGASIFFDRGAVRADLARVGEYGRLLASIGVQGCAVNNVNADPRVIEDAFLPGLARIADQLRSWGVRLSVSVDLSSPAKTGGLPGYDPLDARVSGWWSDRVEAIYRRIPDFGGFVVKADSEGRPGPAAYGRTPADAANMLARLLRPHGGLLFYRAFVYDHHLDWRNPKNDRARAAYDIFHPLDGSFDANVIVQVKHGPIDFQVREPVSPLLGGLPKTRSAIELPVMQEYTGQQRHLCFLAPAWKEVLDFRMGQSPVNDALSRGGYVAVVNVGMGAYWLGHPMGMANLYGFGRLAWDPDLSAAAIAEEWTRMTFGSDPEVIRTVTSLLLSSWRTYESYTGPLGLQTLTDIAGSHFGPSVEASERNGWGQWHRADDQGVGMDRTVSTGTGFAGQYPAEVAQTYENLQSTPDDLLLFFHHVPYTFRLRSGKTVIQYIYDSHYQGAQQAEEYVSRWRSLAGRIDPERFAEVLARLEFQAGHARVWRDSVCGWFARTSGIADSLGRVGRHPDRVEAEDMRLRGYRPVDILPPENASGGKAAECGDPSGCEASFRFEGAAGWYDLWVEYFDQNDGVSRFRVWVGRQLVDEWLADDQLPGKKPGGDTSSRRRIPGLALRPGDEIRVEGFPDGGEHAPLDFIAIEAR